MSVDILLLFLFAGVPYYLLFEKTNIVGKKATFLLTVALFITGLVIVPDYQFEASTTCMIIALVASLFSLYKANKTNNLYRLSYYILFFNAPMMIMFGAKESSLYGISLLVTLFGLFSMGVHYERSYGSANYRSVSGITLVTPYAGLIMTMYLTALALYPPFPNSLLFLNTIINAEIDLLWYFGVIIIFFGNFLIAVRVMAKTVFGKPNSNVHYIDVTAAERVLHLVFALVLLGLSIVGLQEVI